VATAPEAGVPEEVPALPARGAAGIAPVNVQVAAPHERDHAVTDAADAASFM